MSYQRWGDKGELYIWDSKDGLHIWPPGSADEPDRQIALPLRNTVARGNAKALFLALYDHLLADGFEIKMQKNRPPVIRRASR